MENKNVKIDVEASKRELQNSIVEDLKRMGEEEAKDLIREMEEEGMRTENMKKCFKIAFC